jgi:hypothetical protein
LDDIDFLEGSDVVIGITGGGGTEDGGEVGGIARFKAI